MAKKNRDLPGIEGEGVAQKEVPDIDKAAGEYVVLRDRRMNELKGEVIAKTKLAALMKEHKLERYAFDDHIVEMLPGEAKLKVRTAKDEDSDDDND